MSGSLRGQVSRLRPSKLLCIVTSMNRDIATGLRHPMGNGATVAGGRDTCSSIGPLDLGRGRSPTFRAKVLIDDDTLGYIGATSGITAVA